MLETDKVYMLETSFYQINDMFIPRFFALRRVQCSIALAAVNVKKYR